MKLEICTNSYQSAINAQEAGAHRIELCSELTIGGITPSYGLIKQVLEKVSIPVFVLIRPRSGNFTYTDTEFEIMKEDIQFCKNVGCSGIVSGVLNIDTTIDVERTRILIEASKPLPFTFHRAYDWTPDPFKALEKLKSLGVDRILTSGQEISAEKGIELLKQLKEKANNSFIILPGGGVHSGNVSQFGKAGFTEIHASATRIKIINNNPKVSMNSLKFFNETIEVLSDTDKIRSILNNINNEV